MARPAGPSSARPRPSLGRTAAGPRKPGSRDASPRDGVKDAGKEQGKDRLRSARGRQEKPPFFSPAMRAFVVARAREAMGFVLGLFGLLLMVLLGSYDPHDPSLNSVPAQAVSGTTNLFGHAGAYLADLLVQSLGWAAFVIALVPMFWGWRLGAQRRLGNPLFRTVLALWGVILVSMALAGLADASTDPLAPLPGGSIGQILLRGVGNLFGAEPMVATAAAVAGGLVLFLAAGLTIGEWIASVGALGRGTVNAVRMIRHGAGNGVDALRRHGRTAAQAASVAVDDALRGADRNASRPRQTSKFDEAVRVNREETAPAGLDAGPVTGGPGQPGPLQAGPASAGLDAGDKPLRPIPVVAPRPPSDPRKEPARLDPRQASLNLGDEDGPPGYELPPLDLLQLPPSGVRGEQLDEKALQRNAGQLEGVLGDFGVRGEVQKVHPGPVVTLYELEPAPGTKSSRVIGLADDIARSMSAVSVRVAVVPGRNVIGIELPNAKRETVLLRELMAAEGFDKHGGKLALALGKDIGGQPVVADLARFPHLLVAGTTGSGKSVAINTMILSLLYRLPPERCRFIMIDPKMLELSVYEGIPHLLTPVVTDPKKAVVALKWTVREMEDRYRNMSKLGVRNIEGYNARLREARENGESLTRRVQTGFDPDTGKPLFEEQPLDLTELPYIVVIVDEMADLMLVAGKDIEAAIQRLAQMARAAGIHLIMATQRPSVDVITGTIKANFPTRISFQVTSKIDSRTILGEQGAEQLLGQGDMLYMAGGGRITRVHGPFVSDHEVEQIVRFLKAQGEPNYVDAILEDEEGSESFDDGGLPGGAGGSGDDLYDKAVAVVCRERKASTSFIQRQLRIGYNSAARLIERMETEGVVSKPNHSGKREVLARNIDE
ncbi:DNA translocase FtsK [Azospirillum picis]|uniref:DNA translocase FtsK n=1 Tax=Azospirillum picis TaxID=488438 RepID=A0ABU0MDA7_9PROT|nr:DNA translocase FtsK [Azospirillum picis]MBP2297567.1 S-DNA-T family DNA segregation ATPase FtsK/SpoIIIE [Azospirillum picis]MDQ0531410.1 S-DNA-T family DNA segregation ATPase FtsK/SpoIIIE [Azospirillum picis]